MDQDSQVQYTRIFFPNQGFFDNLTKDPSLNLWVGNDLTIWL